MKISQQTIFEYIIHINKIKPDFIKGYLSTIFFLVKLMSDNNLSFNFNLKGIFFISENIIEEKRNFIEQYLSVKTSTFYGHSERLIFGDEIKKGLYTFDKYYGYTEFINLESNKLELIGTGFLNYTMPLIRYRTNDLCIKDNEHYQIIGRWNIDDTLIGKNGEKISHAVYNFHNLVFQDILTYQFLQKQNGYIAIFITTNTNFSEKHDMPKIKKVLHNKFGNILNFTISIIDKPILTKAGKFKTILNKEIQ